MVILFCIKSFVGLMRFTRHFILFIQFAFVSFFVLFVCAVFKIFGVRPLWSIVLHFSGNAESIKASPEPRPRTRF